MLEIRGWRVRSAGPEGCWLFWDPRVETVRLFPGQQPAGGPEVAGSTREGREAEAGRADPPNKPSGVLPDSLQFALLEED